MINTQAIRNKIIDLALRGELTDQLPEDGTAEELYQKILEEKHVLIKTGKMKKSKHLPEVLITETPYEIPENWKWVRVGMITEIAGGTTPSSSEIKKIGTIPYYKVSDMNTPGNETHMVYASNYISENYTGKIFPAGTTIFPKNGGAALTNKRRILTVPSAVDLNTGGCVPIVPEMSDWIRLFMQTIDFGKMDTGSNIPTVNATNLKSQLMVLPPIPEQQRIVVLIKQVFSLLDTIDTLQLQYSDNLSVLKSKLIDAAIQGKLVEQLAEDGTAEELFQKIQAKKTALINTGKTKNNKPMPEILPDEIPFEIPGNWMWVRVGEVAEIAGGTTPASSEVSSTGSVPYFKVSDMNIPGNETHMIHATNYISKGYSGRIFPAGTTIFPKNGGAALTNKRRILVVPSAVDLNTGGCTPIVAEMDDWIRLFMETVDFGHIDTGSNIPTVNATNLKKQPLPLPPLAEQKRIVVGLDEILKIIEI